MLVLVTLLCLGPGWLIAERNRIRARNEWLQTCVIPSGDNDPVTYAPHAQPGWVRWLLGDDSPGDVIAFRLDFHFLEKADEEHLGELTRLEELELNAGQGTEKIWKQIAKLRNLKRLRVWNWDDKPLTDDSLASLAQTTKLEELYLRSLRLTDAGLEHLAALKQMRDLTLDAPRITDAGLAHLAGMTELQVCILTSPKISDAGLTHLANLSQLKELVLDNARITDAGVPPLTKLTQLQKLQIPGALLTSKGRRQLRRALPNTEIECGWGWPLRWFLKPPP